MSLPTNSTPAPSELHTSSWSGTPTGPAAPGPESAAQTPDPQGQRELAEMLSFLGVPVSHSGADQTGQPNPAATQAPAPADGGTRTPYTQDDGATPTPSPPQSAGEQSATVPPAGLIFAAHYELLRKLRVGGMGAVYLARDRRLNRLVAIKMLLLDRAAPSHLARFQAEARDVARFQHPNIIQVYEVGEWQGQPYFSLEYADGGSLDDAIKGEPQPAAQSAGLVAAVARAVQAAHAAGIVHRDLKPANILLLGTKDAPWWQRTPKVSDFGLAKRLDDDSGRTREGSPLGTPSYMAPEQAEGLLKEIGPPTDVWALGAVLYELLTGRPPFKGAEAWQTLQQVIHTDPVPPRQLNPQCPPDLEVICLACLTKERGGRYATAQEVADELQRWLDGEHIVRRPPGRVEKLQKWVRRSPLRAAAAALGVALMVTLVATLGLGLVVVQNNARVEHDQLDRRLRFATKRGEIQSAADRATPGDVATWAAVEQQVQDLLRGAENDPTFDGYDEVEKARQLLEHARAQKATGERTAKLQRHDADAVFFATKAAGLEDEESYGRVEAAADAGLQLFDVRGDNDGPPGLDSRYVTREQEARITAWCYELLLLKTEAVAAPRPGDNEAAARGRIQRALLLLGRAGKLYDEPRYGALALQADLLARRNDPAAADVAQRASRTAPRLAADHFVAGAAAYRGRQYAAAARSMTAALDLDSGHYGARYLLAACQVQLGQHRDATLQLKECLVQRPDFLWPCPLLSYALLADGDYAQAAVYLNRAVEDAGRRDDRPLKYVALVNRGILALFQANWDQAIADLQEARGINGVALPAHVNLALTYQKQGEVSEQPVLVLLAPAATAGSQPRQHALWREAIKVLDEAIKENPEVTLLYHERGRLRLRVRQLDGARDDFTFVSRFKLDEQTAQTLATDLLELGRRWGQQSQWDNAIQACDLVLHVRPQEFAALWLKADALLALGQFEAAGKELDKYLTATRDAPEKGKAWRRQEAFKARGLLHMSKDDVRKALECYTQGLDLGRDPELLTLRGGIYLTRSSPTLAFEDFDEALRERPFDVEALIGRAEAGLRGGKPVQALTDIEAAMLRAQPAVRTYFNAARVYAQLANRVDELRPGRNVTAAELNRRTVALLRKAFGLLPAAADQRNFWGNFVSKEKAFERLAGVPEFEALNPDN